MEFERSIYCGGGDAVCRKLFAFIFWFLKLLSKLFPSGFHLVVFSKLYGVLVYMVRVRLMICFFSHLNIDTLFPYILFDYYVKRSISHQLSIEFFLITKKRRQLITLVHFSENDSG